VLSDPYELKALHLNGQNLSQQGNGTSWFPSWLPGSLLFVHILNKIEYGGKLSTEVEKKHKNSI
jgi:hypothetical protein